MMNEEDIFAALFERASCVRWTRCDGTAHQFLTRDRRVKLFTDSGPQPACYQAEHMTDEAQVSGMPYKTVLWANWIIYQNIANDPAAKGAIENNLIIGGCREALAPLPADRGFLDRRNTLDGLVYHCFISGRLLKVPGDIDNQGMLVIPIKLLVP